MEHSHLMDKHSHNALSKHSNVFSFRSMSDELGTMKDLGAGRSSNIEDAALVRNSNITDNTEANCRISNITDNALAGRSSN